MEILTNITVTAICALALIVPLLVIYMKWRLSYWQRKKMVSLEPCMPFGNLENPLTSSKSQAFQYKMLYEQLKKTRAPIGGMYSFLTPVLIPIDPEYIKSILTKDFQNFQARGFYSNEKDQPISAHLFSVDGARWKNLRAKFTPTFTPGKMKGMFDSILKCTDPMADRFKQHSLQKRPLLIKTMSAYFTTDVIGTCVFGLDCNSFTDPEAKMYNLVRYAMDEATALLKLAFCFSFPDLARKLKLVQFPQDAANYFTDIIVNTIKYREANEVSRTDFLQLLINMKNSALSESDKDVGSITTDEIVAQSFLFFMAGFETSSITIMFCLFELAQHERIQQKVRDEIKAVLANHNKQFTYEALGEMKYLQQVIDETLRKYPSLPVINRKCTEDYKLPNSNTIIETGTEIVIPILGLHHDPEFYPDPDKFDPDRFSEENKRKRHPYTYVPFGEGPRHCIGLRFGTMSVKTAVSVMVKKFIITLNPKTKPPLTFTNKFLLTTHQDIFLDVETIPE